ncbi:MaoC family dehydratase [Duganella sp. FT92W]|uniref:MaoC family dehydratase n=1 Tax=Pseudoduganella rivuli TaxID=2666085 RepID=A0A7X2LU72_9BURK|nr:MaoC family dehydratase [Pseudoduganella rivuli]MRV72722.1 MaoC family dehydratase [Pseudoduganella rivuli]
MRNIATLEEMKTLVGQEVAVSPWFDITQERINQFADATGDHQWIHTDIERARRESPFGGPIAHGFMTIALVPAMLESAVTMVDMKMGVNYGLNKVRLPAPVPAGSRVRARLTIQRIDDIEGGAQVEWGVVIEREGGDKPVCVAELLMRRY